MVAHDKVRDFTSISKNKKIKCSLNKHKYFGQFKHWVHVGGAGEDNLSALTNCLWTAWKKEHECVLSKKGRLQPG